MKLSEKKIKTLKSYHAMLAALSVLGVLWVLFIDNWGDAFVWLPIVVGVCFDGKYEKADELAKLNIHKANTAAMWLLFAAFAVLGMFAKAHTILPAYIVIVICAVLAIRSALFLFFDMTPFSGEKADG
ncbi:MAG: hypothetical protein IKI77_04220 [Oscillospiraceae bacterium]|nr:hypothetical protein [Oscillospiraceae bacterium]